MKYIIVCFLMLVSTAAFAKKIYYPKFEKVLLQKGKYVDLCTGEERHPPLNAKVDLWSVNCGNCLQKIEDKTEGKIILINVDESSLDRTLACVWLKKKNIQSLADADQNIREQMGEAYPLPAELTVQQGKVKLAEIGYWRTNSK